MSVETSNKNEDLSPVAFRVRVFDILMGTMTGVLVSIFVVWSPVPASLNVFDTASVDNGSSLKLIGIAIAVLTGMFWLRLRIVEKLEQILYEKEMSALRRNETNPS